jgi:hypothetical protein
MARILTIVLSTSLALVNVVCAPFRFTVTEGSDMATDTIQNLESSLSEILGINPLSVRVAELALNYGKGTIQSWFQYLHEERGVIRIEDLHKPSLRRGNEW